MRTINTPLDMYTLRQMQPLEAAEHLTGLSLAELRAVAQLLNLKLQRGASKPDLVGLILGATHPAPAAREVAGVYQQERFA